MSHFLTSRAMGDLINGLTYGIVLGLVALSLVLIWRATHILNFAQGPMAMFVTYVGLTQMDHHLNFWVAAAISLVVAMLFGAVVERVLVRPLYSKPEINPIVVLVGLFTLLEAAATAIWGQATRYPATPFSYNYFHIGGNSSAISPYGIFEVIAALITMVAVSLLFNRTKIGLQLRASALAPEVARLLGVRVGRLLTFGWAIAGLVGGIAGVIIAANSYGMSPSMMDAPFILGFIAAAVGGLESPGGAVFAGVLIGVSTQFVDDFYGATYGDFVAIAILIIVLMIRPQGLFSQIRSRRV